MRDCGLKQDSYLPNFFLHSDPSAHIAYTDGSQQESGILAVVKTEPDTSPGSAGLARHIKDWPTEYHFSPLRINLLRPVKHLLHGRVLEIGGGCGALSPYIARYADELVVVEGSPQRARICATRCRGLPNVTVWATNFSRVPASETFDTILLIGVLEYSPSFFETDGQEPFDAVLSKVREHLTPGGRVIIGIENRLGLKYFCGAPEDHAMVQFFGVEDRYGTDRFKTFGRRELIQILRRNGLGHTDLYLPFPDYKLPKVVLHQSAFDEPDIDLEALLLRAPSGDRGRSYRRLATEQFIWPVLMNNGVAADMANSFLMIAAPEPIQSAKEQGLAFYYSIRPKHSFSKETVIVRDETGNLTVRRTSLFDAEHEGYQDFYWVPEDEPFYRGRNYIGGLIDMAKRSKCDAGAIADWCHPWIEFLDAHAVASDDGPCLPENFVDCIPLNLVHDGRALQYFDREWTFPTKPSYTHVVFRGVHWAISAISSMVWWEEARQWTVLDLTKQVLARLLPAVKPEEVEQLIDREVKWQTMIGQQADQIRKLITGQRFTPQGEVQQELDQLAATVRTEQRRADELHSMSAQFANHLVKNLPALRVKGYVDSISYEPGVCAVSGWAFDQELSMPASYVVLMIGNKAVASTAVNIPRMDVHLSLNEPDCSPNLGFKIIFPSNENLILNYQNSKVFAFSTDYIGELKWSRSFFSQQK